MLIPTLIGDYLNLAYIVRFFRRKKDGIWFARMDSGIEVQLAAWFNPEVLSVKEGG